MNTPSLSNPSAGADQTRSFTQEVPAHESAPMANLRGSFRSFRIVDAAMPQSFLQIWNVRTVAIGLLSLGLADFDGLIIDDSPSCRVLDLRCTASILSFTNDYMQRG